MAIHMTFTHGWSKLFFLIKGFSFLFFSIFFIALIIIPVETTLGIDAVWLGLLFSLFISFYVHYKWLNNFYNSLSTLCYVRLNLRTPISLKEAKEISFLFTPNKTSKWYPMKQIASIPRVSRRMSLFAFVVDINRKREEDDYNG